VGICRPDRIEPCSTGQRSKSVKKTDGKSLTAATRLSDTGISEWSWSDASWFLALKLPPHSVTNHAATSGRWMKSEIKKTNKSSTPEWTVLP
jgi:hypothetical protein